MLFHLVHLSYSGDSEGRVMTSLSTRRKTNVKPVYPFSSTSQSVLVLLQTLTFVFLLLLLPSVLFLFFSFSSCTLNYYLTKTTNPASLFVAELFLSSFSFTMISNLYNVVETESTPQTHIHTILGTMTHFHSFQISPARKVFSACPIDDD